MANSATLDAEPAAAAADLPSEPLTTLPSENILVLSRFMRPFFTLLTLHRVVTHGRPGDRISHLKD